ncbi:YicC/YloC family endoribonuclease [Thermopetrobacter sp. TC1]|uniref:YicC/YloC family endoribonuclease n=1 Tax=Thermopetrobacter sp. TC1 TaxID=1495045 RepID=UPI0005704732|nr:YicC/YloC family endoribonuclease [Thermopetrobacter sp. TC1]
MALSSMTGFARATGQTDTLSWSWEIRSVNGKGLDVRLRLPNGFEALDPLLRKELAARFSRGSMQVGLQVRRAADVVAMRVNSALLDWLIEEVRKLEGRLGMTAAPVDPARLLALRGVLEPEEEDPDAVLAAVKEPLLESFRRALDDLEQVRRKEGARITEVLKSQVDQIADLVQKARENPARSPEAVRERLRQQVQRLLEASQDLDEQRLYQEAVILAAKADVEEELDRLAAHVAAARELLAGNGPAGRKLDFLAQEFNREANTLCAKSNDASLTRIGLDLKAVIDQFREQVQNVE